jgi:LysR family transcriptional regulator of gallate degradation
VKPLKVRLNIDRAGHERPVVGLRHLRVLSAVASAGSATKAAHRLFRVSSAVARAVSELEDALGVRLFERRSRGMVTTAYGESVLLRARRIDHELDDARAQLVAGGGVSADRDVHAAFSTGAAWRCSPAWRKGAA